MWQSQKGSLQQSIRQMAGVQNDGENIIRKIKRFQGARGGITAGLTLPVKPIQLFSCHQGRLQSRPPTLGVSSKKTLQQGV